MKTHSNIKHFPFYLCLGAVWLLLCVFTLVNNTDTFAVEFLNEIWRTAYLVGVNFIFFEYSLPFITKKRSTIVSNILIGVLLTAVHLIVISFGLYAWRNLGIDLHIYTQLREITLAPNGRYHELLVEVFYEAESGLISVFFFGMAKLFHYNYRLRLATQQLRLEKQEAELSYLKSQTNPHFLFNTLNNIYALAKDKSDLAPEAVLRLSKILRFMLYETNERFITLEQELEIINDYIALEKLRYDDSLRISLKYDIENPKQQLPPLLLIPLVENAFKHGVSETGNEPFIDVHLFSDQQELTFVIKNSAENLQGDTNVKENIGLSNIRRQLALLYSDYNLSVGQAGSVFTAILKINLSSHV